MLELPLVLLVDLAAFSLSSVLMVVLVSWILNELSIACIIVLILTILLLSKSGFGTGNGAVSGILEGARPELMTKGVSLGLIPLSIDRGDQDDSNGGLRSIIEVVVVEISGGKGLKMWECFMG